MRTAGRIAIAFAGIVVLLLLAGGGFLQTGAGKSWLAGTISRLASTPTTGLKVGSITGFVPFDIRVDRIELSDAAGPWLAIDRAALSWSPSALVHGRLKIDHLRADRIEMIRQPGSSSSQNTSSGFKLPVLPVDVELDDLSVAGLAIGRAAGGGDDAAAALTAHGLLARGQADLAVRLTRIDNQPGSGTLNARYDQAADALDLDLDIDEPTGILLDAALARTDKLPLRATLKGAGPLDGWKGRLVVAARDIINADTSIEIAHTTGSRIALNGVLKVVKALPVTVRPVAGDEIRFDIVAAESGKNAVMLAPSRISAGGVTITVEGARGEDGGLTGKLSLTLPDSSALDPLVGMPVRGSLLLDAVLSGSTEHPQLALIERGRIALGQIAFDGVSLDTRVDAASHAKSDNPTFALHGDGRIDDVRDAAAGGQSYGPLKLGFAGTTDVKGTLVGVQSLVAAGAGIDLRGQGSFRNGVAEGKATLKTADLEVVGKLLGQTLHGAANVDLTISSGLDRTISVQATATGDRLGTGIDVADALLAGPVKLDAKGARSADGRIALSRLVLSSSRARLEGDGVFNESNRAISANLKATLNDLPVLSGAASSPLVGAGTIAAKIGGTIGAPSLDADAALDGVSMGAMRVDHFDARIHAPKGLNGAVTADGRIVSGKLDEKFDAAVQRAGSRVYRIDRLHLAGAGGTADAAFTLDLGASRLGGKLDVAIPDLSLWSGLTGASMAGQLALSATLPGAKGGQGPVRIIVDRLALGTGPDTVAIAHAVVTGSVSGDFGHPEGAVDLTLDRLKTGAVALATASAHVTSKGMLANFTARGAGRMKAPLTFDLAGSIDSGRAATSLRLTSLALSLGPDKLSLAKPASATFGPGTYQLSGLALAIDGGSLDGDASVSPTKVSANLRLRQLPLHPIGLLASERFVGGTLDGALTLTGTPTRPDAHATLSTKGLDLETGGPRPRPELSLTAKLDWRGERANLDMRVGTGAGEQVNLTGSAPLAFDLAALAMRQPADPSLNLKLTGGGSLENLTSIVPLGEDRVSGAFTVNVAVGGTLAAPHPSGRVAITRGRYANLALGTVIDGIDLQVSGVGHRFVLDRLTATDGKAGKLNASGSIDLGVAPAKLGFDLGFSNFLVVRNDNTTINANGALALAGTLKDMKVTGKLGVVRAELYIPDRLPRNVVALDVIEIGGRQTVEAPKAEPVAPVALAIALDAPGQVFVRGHGVNSEWRGHVDVTGNTAGPILAGQLTVVHGNISLLGQNFGIDRGTVNFLGGHEIDPALNVQASASASSVTAQVNVTGTARLPKIALSSTPALPRDEILARVLFGQNVGSLTPSQGIQLAAAAAQLAQGGPGVMDRVRNSIGLDRLDFSGGANGARGAGTGSQAAKGTTVSGGKYIADGVFVGVSQGLAGNSQAKVEIEITPNISANSTFGTVSGSGFGAKYSIDY